MTVEARNASTAAELAKTEAARARSLSDLAPSLGTKRLLASIDLYKGE